MTPLLRVVINSSSRVTGRRSHPRVYVCLEDEVQGLAGALIESADLCLGRGPRIEAFGVTEVAYDPNGLFGDMWYELARGIHETYRARRAADRHGPREVRRRRRGRTSESG